MKRLSTPNQWIILSVLAVLMFLVALPVMAAGTPDIDWYVIGSGGGSTTVGDYTLSGIIGQPVVGLASSGDPDLCSGFWCRVLALVRIFLPIVLKN